MSYWKQFPQASCLPDNCDCEFVRDAWIGQPSAFVSSFSYIFFALFLYWLIPKKSKALKLWTMSFVLLGLCSHFAHASFIEMAMAMDFACIILVLSFFFINKWMSRWVKSTWVTALLLLCYQGGLWLTFYSLEKWFKVSLCVIVFFFCIFELMHSEGKAFVKAKEVHWAIVILMISFSFFMTDELKLICDPHSWLQGHSVWHVGTSISLFLYGKWRFRPVELQEV
jgi:hypothetical protein